MRTSSPTTARLDGDGDPRTLSLTLPASAQSPSSIRFESTTSPGSATRISAAPSRTGHDYADLAKLGVKTVINLIGDQDLDATEQASVEEHGMRYVQIPMSTRKAPTAQQLETFLVGRQ